MKKPLLYLLLNCLIFSAWSDMPGNKPRKQVAVSVLLGDLAGYSIYSNGPYSNYGEDNPVTDSSEHILSGGFGAPPCIAFFGVNKQEKHTDTIMICNEEQGNVTLKLSVQNGKLVSEERISIKQETTLLVPDDNDTNPNPSFFNKPINILIISAFVAMLLLVGLYFFAQRKKQAV